MKREGSQFVSETNAEFRQEYEGRWERAPAYQDCQNATRFMKLLLRERYSVREIGMGNGLFALDICEYVDKTLARMLRNGRTISLSRGFELENDSFWLSFLDPKSACS